MAFDFPASPTEGQVFSPPGAAVTYRYRNPVWEWLDPVTSGIAQVPTRADLRAADTGLGVVFLSEAPRQGLFAWTAGDFTSWVVMDTTEGVYVKATATPATSGCWVRQDIQAMDPCWFGAVADGAADDLVPLQRCWMLAAALRIPCCMYGRQYNCSESVFTDTGLTVYGEGAVMYITAWPLIGGFVNNVWTYDPAGGGSAGAYARRVQHNVVLDGLTLDGSKLPPPVPVAAPGPYQNTNLHDWGWGMYDATVRNCEFRYMRYGYNQNKTQGGGGGGTGGEQGLHDCVWENNYIHHCHRGIRIAGSDDVHPENGEIESATGIVFRNTRIEECGCAVFIHSVTPPGITSDDDIRVMDVDIDGVHARNCGHEPWRDFDFTLYPAVQPQKTGIIVLAKAQNVRINNFQCVNDSNYTTRTDWLGRTGYPAAGQPYIGAGANLIDINPALAGVQSSSAIGAVVWGYGRNIKVENLSYYGDVDNVYYAAPAPGWGDIATVAIGSTGYEALNFEISGYRQPFGLSQRFLGAHATVVDAGVSMKFEQVNSDVVPNIEAVGAQIGSASVWLETVRGQGFETRGTASQWRATGALFGSEPVGIVLLGGLAVSDGYSATGTRAGATWDPAAGIWRQSVTGSGVQITAAYYGSSGLVTQDSISGGSVRRIGLSSAAGVFLTANAGTPEGVVTASPGALCVDTTGGKLYVKSTGAAAAGWVVAGTQT